MSQDRIQNTVRTLLKDPRWGQEPDMWYMCRRMVCTSPVDSPLAVLQWEIVKWAVRHGLYHDVWFYSTRDWADRKESVGNQALFTMTAEGALMDVIYRGIGEQELRDQFDAMVDATGLYYEFGYCWSVHFYTKQPLTAKEIEDAETKRKP